MLRSTSCVALLNHWSAAAAGSARSPGRRDDGSINDERSAQSASCCCCWPTGRRRCRRMNCSMMSVNSPLLSFSSASFHRRGHYLIGNRLPTLYVYSEVAKLHHGEGSFTHFTAYTARCVRTAGEFITHMQRRRHRMTVHTL